MDNKKEKIYLIIDVMHTDDSHQEIYIVKDYYTDGPPECTAGTGYYLDEYRLEEDLEHWEENYNIEIKEEYR